MGFYNKKVNKLKMNMVSDIWKIIESYAYIMKYQIVFKPETVQDEKYFANEEFSKISFTGDATNPMYIYFIKSRDMNFAPYNHKDFNSSDIIIMVVTKSGNYIFEIRDFKANEDNDFVFFNLTNSFAITLELDYIKEFLFDLVNSRGIRGVLHQILCNDPFPLRTQDLIKTNLIPACNVFLNKIPDYVSYCLLEINKLKKK